MKRSLRNATYPDNWDEIATAVKVAAGKRCARCRHPAEGPWKLYPKLWSRSACDRQCSHEQDEKQRVLTVHHLDMNPSNCAWWNTAPLCQACHLAVQARYHLHQYYLLRPPEWLKPYIQGWALWAVTGITVVNVRYSDFDIYGGRPNKWLREKHPCRELGNPWANPFPIKGDVTRERSIEMYRAYIRRKIAEDPERYDLRTLIGNSIGCWCKPLPCHLDVVAELVAEMLTAAALDVSTGNGGTLHNQGGIYAGEEYQAAG